MTSAPCAETELSVSIEGRIIVTPFELFQYIIQRDLQDGQYVKKAKEMCGACPLNLACLGWGVGEQGVWGGLTTKERAKLGNVA